MRCLFGYILVCSILEMLSTYFFYLPMINFIRWFISDATVLITWAIAAINVNLLTKKMYKYPCVLCATNQYQYHGVKNQILLLGNILTMTVGLLRVERYLFTVAHLNKYKLLGSNDCFYRCLQIDAR